MVGSVIGLLGSVSFLLIAATQTGPIDDWVGIGIWMGVAAAFVGGALSVVAYRLNKKDREDDIESAQSYMDGIKKMYEDVSVTRRHPNPRILHITDSPTLRSNPLPGHSAG